MAKLTNKINYEYECPECRDKTQIRRVVDERDNTVTCEKCNKSMVRKLSLGFFKI